MTDPAQSEDQRFCFLRSENDFVSAVFSRSAVKGKIIDSDNVEIKTKTLKHHCYQATLVFRYSVNNFSSKYGFKQRLKL